MEGAIVLGSIFIMIGLDLCGKEIAKAIREIKK
jgi:hypothetical protein